MLVVDDEDMVRDLARLVLERRGYRVLTACDGEEALTQYGAHPGQIDAGAAGLHHAGADRLAGVRGAAEDGPAGVRGVLQRLRPARRRHAAADRRRRAFVPKPYRPDDLVQAVRKVLGEKAEKSTPASRDPEGSASAERSPPDRG